MDALEQTGNQPSEAAVAEAPAEHQPFWEQLDQPTEEQNPEPTEETGETETQDEVAPENAETQESEEEDANWLPDEQQKVFPDDVLAKYAKRYGYTPEEIAADPRIAATLKDKLNSDIWIAQQRRAQEDAEILGEPTAEEEAEEPAQEVAEQTAQTPEQRTQWLEKVVTEGVDQKAVEQWGRNFLISLGVNPNAEDPAAKAEAEAALKMSGTIGKQMAIGVVDLLSTLLPQFMPALLPQVIEQQYPKFGEMHGRTLYQLAWEQVRSSKPEFANLPTYGKDMGAVLEKAQASIPNFDQIANRLTGSPYEKAVTLYTLLASHVAGEKATPQQVKTALETGKKAAKDAERSRAAGKILGAGQSQRQFAPAKPKDDFASMIEEYNQSQRSTPIR